MLGILGVWVGDPQAAVHQAAASEEAPLLDACRYDVHMCEQLWIAYAHV